MSHKQSAYAKARANAEDDRDWGRNMNTKLAETCVSAMRGILVNEMSDCESPIEELFLVAICGTYHLRFDDVTRATAEAAMSVGLEPRAMLSVGRWLLAVQESIGPHRVDFALATVSAGGRPLAVVVECDGHDFHEKTKEQARKDKSRDRDLQSRGFRVLRFAGSELYRNPFECVEQLEEFADAECARLDAEVR